MHSNRTRKQNGLRPSRWVALIGLLVVALSQGLQSQAQENEKEISKKLRGFDAYMQKVLKDWNAPGVGVGAARGNLLERERELT